MINWFDDFVKDKSSILPCFLYILQIVIGLQIRDHMLLGIFSGLLACSFSFFLGGGGAPHSPSIIRGFSSHTDGQHIDTVKTTFSTKRGAAQLDTDSMRARLPDLAVNWIYTKINLLKIYGELLLTGYRTGSSAIS